MIEGRVRGYTVDPGGKGGFAPEAFQRLADLQENRLGEIGGFGLRLSALDMAKIGELYRQDGLWQGKQLLPAGWRPSTVIVGLGRCEMHVRRRPAWRITT